MNGHMQIGEVASRTGLSLRTIRYYGEVGLVEPSSRTDGGFRLYTDTDVDRLLLIKQMKPLEFSLEEMRELLRVLDELNLGGDTHDRAELLDKIGLYYDLAEQRCAQLRTQLEGAEGLADLLRGHLQRRGVVHRG